MMKWNLPAAWKASAKENRIWMLYFRDKAFEWQGMFFKERARAEAAEKQVNDLIHLNMQKWVWP